MRKLLQTSTAFVRLLLRRLDSGIWATVATSELRSVERGCASHNKGSQCVTGVMGMFVVGHCFEGGEAAHDLDYLHNQKHCDPDELQGRPDGENDSERVGI